MAIEQFLTQYFLNPLGLLGLLGLIGIVVLYLTRPKPERKVMPSMQFFQEKEKKSKLRKAFSMLKTNSILILNLLVVLMASLALAGFYLEGSGSSETVIVYDTSASMHEEHAEAVSTVLSEASTQNTVIVAGEALEVFEEVNRQSAADIIRDNPPGYTGSDMAAAAQRARSYDGSILLLSDLDVGESTLEEYRALGNSRGLKQIDYSTENDLGFVDVGEGYVEVKNYRSTRFSTFLSVNSESQEFEIGPEETKRIEVNLKQGENRVELPNDGFSPDNEVFIYVPEDEKIGVEYHGSENRFVHTALNEISTVEKSGDGEVLILNEKNAALYSDERPKVLMQGSSAHWANNSKNSQVELGSPFNLRFESKLYDVGQTGSSWSEPENALFAEDNKFYYNIEDSKIRNEFIYPVLWKNMVHELKEPKNFDSSNERIIFSSHDSPGFYESKAVNYLNEEESNINANSLDEEHTQSALQQNQSQILALLLLLLISMETVLILERGTYQ